MTPPHLADAPHAEAPGLAWLLNLDAELELASSGYCSSTQMLRHIEQHGQGARALLGPHDVLVEPEEWLGTHERDGAHQRAAQARQGNGRLGRAWCPTPRALAALRRAGAAPEDAPDVEILRRVNHRRFGQLLGRGLPSRCFVESAHELERILTRDQGPWLLKRPLSFAGRGQLRLLGQMELRERSWIAASFRRDGLLLEPLVRPLLEVCLHGFLTRKGEAELGRACVQEVSGRGVFRGVRIAGEGELDGQERGALLQAADAVAESLHDAGYFGPFGIDGYRYEHQGRQAFCALGEINARYTMGFSVGFPRPAHLLRV